MYKITNFTLEASYDIPYGVGGGDGRGTYPNNRTISGSISVFGLASASFALKKGGYLDTVDSELSATCIGTSDTDSVDTPFPGGNAPISGTGSFSFSCPCQVVQSITTIETPLGTTDEHLNNFYKRIEDSPFNTGVSFLVYTIPDSTATLNVSVAGCSISLSVSTGSVPVLVELARSLSIDGLYSDFTGSGAFCNIEETSTSVNGCSVGGKNVSASKSGTYFGSTVSASSIAYTSESGVGLSLESAGLGGAEAYTTRTHYGDRHLNLSGIIANPKQTLTTPSLVSEEYVLNLYGCTNPTKTLSGGAWSENVIQKKCQQGCTARAQITTTTGVEVDYDEEPAEYIDEFEPVWSEITNASLTANGYQTRDSRHMFRGKAIQIASVTQDLIFSIDNGNSLTPANGNWSASTDWSIAVVSSNLNFSGTVNGGKITRTFNEGKGFFAGYRYLRIQIFNDEPSSFKIKIISSFGEKIWSLKNNFVAGSAYLYIDMMYPTARTERYDSNNTRYPEDEKEYPNESVYYGVGRVEKIEFYELKKDTEYRIENIDLVRQISTSGFDGFNAKDNVFILSNLKDDLVEWKPESVVSEIGTTTRFYRNRALIAQQDGIGNSLEEASLLKQVTVGGATGVTVVSYQHTTLEWLINRLVDRYPGITITQTVDSTPSGDYFPPAEFEYFNVEQMLLAYVFGNGLLATRDGWVSGINTNLSSIGRVQPVYDRLLEWPGLKTNLDFFDVSNSTPTIERPLTLMFGTTLGQKVYGEVLENRKPKSGLRVNTQQFSTEQGHGITDIRSWYETNSPFLKTASAKAIFKSTEALFESFQRMLQRVIFKATAGDFANNITGFSKNGTISAAFDEPQIEIRLDNTNALLDSSNPYEKIVGLYQSAVTGRLYILDQVDDVCNLYHSFDSGKTSRLMLEIECTTIGIACYEEAGIITLLYEDSSDGLVKYKISPNNGIDFNSGSVSFAGTTVEGSIKGLYYNKKGKLHALITGTDDITKLYASFDFGKTWKQR